MAIHRLPVVPANDAHARVGRAIRKLDVVWSVVEIPKVGNARDVRRPITGIPYVKIVFVSVRNITQQHIPESHKLNTTRFYIIYQKIKNDIPKIEK